MGSPDKEDDGVEEDVFLRQLENTMLKSVTLRGVPGIKQIFLIEHTKVVINEEGGFNSQDHREWTLETDGVNLKVMSKEGVDFKRTYSNSCTEVFKILGIEAARAAIFKELRSVIEFDGSKVNFRHLALLCDLMTHCGHLVAITWHGINCANTGASIRSSFEETVEVLMEAATVGERDDCHGISENIIFGQMAPMGARLFDIAVDIDMLKDAIVDHRLPMHKMLTAQADRSMTPGQVMITPYDADSLMWEGGMFKGESAAFSPLAGNGGR